MSQPPYPSYQDEPERWLLEPSASGLSHGWLIPKPEPESWWKKYGRHLVLFVLTCGSVYMTGELVMGSGVGLPLTVALMSILLAHEMGHYLACVYYGIDATLPFFLPLPFVTLVGTLGAFIRVRSPFPNRRALFDMGIAGPLAGFAVCLPVLFLGALEARVIPTPADSSTLRSFADPLIMTWIFGWLRGDVPDGYSVLMGPLMMAGWFGCLVTALNLMPIGQLDGGHATYALFGSHANRLSRWLWWCCVALVAWSPSWILWAVLLRALGRAHPPTLNDRIRLDRGRVLVALVSLGVFCVCFMANPLMVSWPTVFDALRESFTSR